MSALLIGYARVATDQQDLTRWEVEPKGPSQNKMRVSEPIRGAGRHPIPCRYHRYRLRNRATPSIHGSTPKPCNLFRDGP